jgi:hypothetical protein
MVSAQLIAQMIISQTSKYVTSFARCLDKLLIRPQEELSTAVAVPDPPAFGQSSHHQMVSVQLIAQVTFDPAPGGALYRGCS